MDSHKNSNINKIIKEWLKSNNTIIGPGKIYTGTIKTPKKEKNIFTFLFGKVDLMKKEHQKHKNENACDEEICQHISNIKITIDEPIEKVIEKTWEPIIISKL